MRTIVLNTNNLVQDGQNNKMVYKFPNSVVFKNNSIAVSSITMYYSWNSISASQNNNIFTYTWTAGGTTTTYTMTIPDGTYNVDDLNAFMQFQMIQNNTYLIDDTGTNVYYAELLLNVPRYAVELSTFLVPTTLPTGWSTPSGFPGLPTTTQNIVVSFPPFFNEIVGYVPGFTSDANVSNSFVPPLGSQYVSKLANGTISYVSTMAPNVQPNSSVYVAISNINNPYSIPSSIIYAIVPTVAVGSLIVERPPQLTWNKMIDGNYNQLTLSFLNQDYQQIQIKDPNMTLLLAIKDAEEYGGK